MKNMPEETRQGSFMSTEPGLILIVDDDPDVLHVLGRYFNYGDFRAHTAASGIEALRRVAREQYDAVLCDMAMPRMDGLEVLREIKRIDRRLPLVVMTGVGTVENAVDSMREGAFDYVAKPVDLKRLGEVLGRAVAHGRLERSLNSPRPEEEEGEGDPFMAASSEGMRQVFRVIDKVAPSDVPVLLLGETGTGKSHLARTIHEKSPRRSGPFVTIDCSALSPGVIESELFGHLKGACTGAGQDKPGLMQEAHGGTIFLDEIGELPPQTQVKLLRAIQDLVVRPVGGVTDQAIDVRYISATSQDLQKPLRGEGFRKDLFYRLSVVSLTLPPLRERKGDVIPLVDLFIKRFNVQYGKEIVNIDPRVIRYLLSQDWPGNIRELKNTLERAVLFSEGDRLEIGDFGLPPEQAERLSAPAESRPLKDIMREAEKAVIVQTLRESGGNRALAAKALGIGRRTLYNKLEYLGIEDE